METYITDADNIWKDYKHRLTHDSVFMKMSAERRLEFYQKIHHEFTMLFPLVIRYMVQFGQYNTAAFRKYIKKLQLCPYKSELEYCERQADYVKYLYIENSGSHNYENAKTMWKKTYDALVKELEIFKESENIIKQKMEKNNMSNSMERREELKKELEALNNVHS